MYRFLPTALLLLCAVLAAGCSDPGTADDGDPSDGDPGAPDAPVGESQIFPPLVHAGFDGASTFRVPVSMYLADGAAPVMWSIADPSLADITAVDPPAEFADFGESWAMVTTKAAGTTRIQATVSGETYTADLTITAYEQALVEAGRTRYSADAAGNAARQPCADCHLSTTGADHSPLTMSYYTDDTILTVVKTGSYPAAEGGYTLPLRHAWELTGDEEPGIVAFLRTLTPRGFAAP